MVTAEQDVTVSGDLYAGGIRGSKWIEGHSILGSYQALLGEPCNIPEPKNKFSFPWGSIVTDGASQPMYCDSATSTFRYLYHQDAPTP